ncbi:hypothetical protein [Micromonospora sp. S4605]|uniref:hypothetical protein n=1 Tax=Micromonospora sp. S4605 TaxID=1420897 RepID=UPI001E60DE09|nr:hypothetical protein [Micromonospora sp. S4605]
MAGQRVGCAATMPSTSTVSPPAVNRSPRAARSTRRPTSAWSISACVQTSTRQATSTAPVAAASVTVAVEASDRARAVSRAASSVPSATATWIDRSRPTSGAASHWPTALSWWCTAVVACGARNASKLRPGRAPSRQTRPIAAIGTIESTASRSPTGRPPNQDSQERSARHCGDARHRQATRSSATPTMESTYRAVSDSASTRHSALITSSLRPRPPGRIQIATLQSMKGSRKTSDSVRVAVPEGRSLQRYASSTTPADPRVSG